MAEPTEPSAHPGRKRLPPLVRRLMGLLLLGLLAIGITVGYRYFWYARPFGRGPAGPAVPVERFEDDLETWSDRTVVLLGIGDSVTAGFGASPGLGYFDRLVENPKNEFPDMEGKCLSKVLPKLIQRNLAVAGFNSLECLEHQIPKIGVQEKDAFGIVVMTIGGNDIIHNYGRPGFPPKEGAMYGATLEQAAPWIENFRTRLDEIIDQIQEKFPGGCEFFIANIYDPTDGVGDAENAGLPRWPDGLRILQRYNGIVAAAAESRKNVVLVNMHDAFLGHGIHCLKFWQRHYDSRDPRYWYGENLEDPNDRGYDALRRLFLTEMARVLPPLLEDGD